MELVLEIVKGEKLYINSYKFNQKSGFVGRSNEANFTLEDKSSHISSKHVLIEYKDSFYFITDVSTNGTYLKNPYRKLPKDMPIKINNSDIFIIGDYEIKARLLDNEINTLGFNSFNHLLGNNNGLSSKMLIPDDDFLSGNNSIMKNSFLKEEKFESLNNIMDIYEQKDSSILSMLNNTTSMQKSEEIFIDETINNLNEHIEEKYFNLNVFDEGLECELEDEIENPPLLNSSSVSFEILEKSLGINISSLQKEEQDKILTEIAQIVLYSINFLKISLDIKDKILNDLSLDKSGSSSEALNPIRRDKKEALMVLSNSKNEVILISEAIKKSFTEIDNHNLALAKSCEVLVNSFLKEFEVDKLEDSFYKNYNFKSFIPKKFQLWDAYISNYNKLLKNNQEMVLALKTDLSKEYENQINCFKTISI